MTNTDRARAALTNLARKFSDGEFVPTVARTMIRAPEIPSTKWSLGNQMLMWFEGTEDARGYNQWGQVGRHVKKGSKAIYILAPNTRMVPDKDENGNEKDTKHVIITGFRGMPVFRYEDTDGKPLEQYKPRTIPPLMELAEMNGFRVEYGNSGHGESGYISVGEKRIHLSTEDPATFLHELVHMYDFKSHERKGGQDPTQEIVAQLGAAVLCEMYGATTPGHTEGYTYQYVANYIKDDDPEAVGRACFKVLGRVHKAITAILSDARAVPATPSPMGTATAAQNAVIA